MGAPSKQQRSLDICNIVLKVVSGNGVSFQEVVFRAQLAFVHEFRIVQGNIRCKTLCFGSVYSVLALQYSSLSFEDALLFWRKGRMAQKMQP